MSIPRSGLRLVLTAAAVVILVACNGNSSDESTPTGPSSTDASGPSGGGGSGSGSGPAGGGPAPNSGGGGGSSENDTEVTARVDGRAGSCPNLTFRAGSQPVVTTAATFFRRVTCELLVNGQLVEVEGPVVSGSLRADKVQLEDAQGVERRGALTGLSGICPSLTFSVGGSGPTFITNGNTAFKDLACTAIRNGLAVRADGHVQSNAQALAERVRPQ